MSSYASWAEFEVILVQDCKLLKLLYSFLQDDNLRTSSCECLLHILSRKGDVKRTAEQREKLLLLLSKEAIQGFVQSLQVRPVLLASGDLDEEQYVFLKRICQVLVHLGISQLGPLWLNGKEDFKVPADFEHYLNIMLEFTKHDSQLLSTTSCDVWATFINHNHIKDNECFRKIMPFILTECREKFAKFGDPAQTDHISSAFSKVDFDSEGEYIRFYSNYRTKMSRIVGQLCLMHPRTAAKEAVLVVTNLVQCTTTSDRGRHSMEFIKWEAFASYLECWTNSFKSEPGHKDIDEVKSHGISVLQHLVAYNTQSALLLQCQFRCLQSGLLAFLHLDHKLFQDYTDKVFNSVGFMGGCTDKYDLPKDVVTARNSIVTCFTHLCDTQSKVLAPHINYLSTIYEERVKRDELVYAEKCSFMEALLILSLEVHTLSEQSGFVKDLMQEVYGLFEAMKSCVSSVEEFIKCFGLDKDPSDPSYQSRKRLSLCYIVNTVTHILRRSKPVVELAPSITQPQEHPTYYHVLPLVAHFCIPLLKILYLLWSGEFKPKMSVHFHELDQLHPFERDNILGKTMMRRSDEVTRTEVKSLQMNLAAIHEACLQSIARALVVYGYQHMHDTKVVESTLNSVFPEVIHLNHWRLRVLLRHLINPMVIHCPTECWDNVLFPFVYQMCHLVFKRLQESWVKIQQRQAEQQPNDGSSDGRNEKEEIFNELLTVSLSREYSDLLELLCVMKIDKKAAAQEGTSEDMDMADETVPSSQASEQGSSEQWSLFCDLSPLGERLLANKDMYDILFYSSFYGLAWKDTHTANKCTCVAGLIYQKVIMNDLIPIVPELFQQVLTALNIHGIHDHVRSQLSFLALLIYQSAILKFPHLGQILMELSQVDEAKIKAFNNLLQKKPPPSIKTKKEKFKDILKNVIGKHISEVHKHKLTFDLPEMQFKRKVGEDAVNLSESNLFEDTSS